MNDSSPLRGTWPRGFNRDTPFAWPLARANDLVTLNYGKGLLEKNRVEGTVPVYGTNGQCGWHAHALTNGPGLILGRKGMGNLGVKWCPTDFWVIDTAYFVTPKVELDLKFFYYMVGYIGLNHLKDGTSNPSLSRDTFYAQLLPNPPVIDQQAIACILGALDDKIELNLRRIRTLEAAARAIFQSWFVDFDPVRAKAAGRMPARLSSHLAALFPDSFDGSPIGQIPKGWRITSLADEITASKGLSYKGDSLAGPGQGLPMHNLNSVYEGGGYKHEGLKWYTGEYRPAHLLKPGDVIVTNTEQGFEYLLIGYAAIIPKQYGDNGLFSHHIYRIQAKDTSYLPTWFTYLLLRTPVFHELVAGHSNGTTVNMLPLDGLQKPRFVLPPEELVIEFGRVFSSTQQQLEVLYDENLSLAGLRDTLLPKLISGELRVPDAERIVGRAK